MTIHQTTGVVPVDAYLRGMERLATVTERLREDFARVFAEPPPPSIRKSCERMIEDLIAVVDACDDDPDLESTGDEEPSLGWLNRPGQAALSDDGGSDREGDDTDLEPALGWTDMEARYGRHSIGDDRERDLDVEEGEDNEDREPDAEGEPSLGSTGVIDQTHWGKGSDNDGEEQPEDEVGYIPPLASRETLAAARAEAEALLQGRGDKPPAFGRMLRPEERYYFDAGNGQMVQVVAVVG